MGEHSEIGRRLVPYLHIREFEVYTAWGSSGRLGWGADGPCGTLIVPST